MKTYEIKLTVVVHAGDDVEPHRAANVICYRISMPGPADVIAESAKVESVVESVMKVKTQLEVKP